MTMLKITLFGEPRTKKNSQRIIRAGKRNIVIPSKAYEEYENACLWQIAGKHKTLNAKMNLKCTYYLKQKRRVDLANLIEATQDILTAAFTITDDNIDIIGGLDGCRVYIDKDNPRVEIELTEMQE